MNRLELSDNGLATLHNHASLNTMLAVSQQDLFVSRLLLKVVSSLD